MTPQDAADVGRRASELLRSLPLDITWAPGLGPEEFDAIEQRFDIEFADEHRAFLAAGVPVGGGFPDWRYRWWGLRPDPLFAALDSSVEDVLFDVGHDQFWHPAWGIRPDQAAAAIAVARGHLATAPRLIPVFIHRCLPPGAGLPPRAVMSVHQTDVIFYGDELYEWVRMEFVMSAEERKASDRTPISEHPLIPFWTDVINQDWLDD